MVLLQHRLSLKVSQRQILTPGLVQMVSVLALNKLELKDMINTEMVENPVLEELDDAVPLVDDVEKREEERERPSPVEENPVAAVDKKDPFEEIDFGSFFQEYLDPGFRSPGQMEEIERPSFENFLSKPSNLTDHLMWQLGSIPTRANVREAAELVIGNLNEDGYLIATDDELLGIAPPAAPEQDAAKAESVVADAAALGLGPTEAEPGQLEPSSNHVPVPTAWSDRSLELPEQPTPASTAVALRAEVAALVENQPARPPVSFRPSFDHTALRDAVEIVRQMDPPGVACRDLRECLLYQLRFHQRNLEEHRQPMHDGHTAEVIQDAVAVVDQHLRALQLKQHKEIAKAISRPIEAVLAALEFIRTLDPRPGLRYNTVQPRLIEPDVAFVKHGDEWLVVMNDEDLPTLRLNPAYKRLLTKDGNDKDTRNYVKERYKSAIQLIKNIEQRKQTIMKVCYAIVGRQQDFLEKGIDQLKPMMIKEVAEEIGVHPSTVSRAVANKYAHTPQGVFELRYFFSESVNGPEGGATSLLILKRRVKKLIEEEDPTRPLTDEQITRILQSQGIQVTRRTVAKYREDMRIPSTHQRRVKQ
ncbi:MAG: RNA polymerase factor sigma-54 [Acidobacteria bacterium]|nr:RNA polymerase factor sigma-54 [Acidobacteriota bacterium]